MVLRQQNGRGATLKENSIENAVFSQSGEQSVIAIRTRGTNPVGYAFRQKPEGRPYLVLRQQNGRGATLKENSIENAVFSQSGEQSVITSRTRGPNPVGYAFRQKSEGRP